MSVLSARQTGSDMATKTKQEKNMKFDLLLLRVEFQTLESLVVNAWITGSKNVHGFISITAVFA